ncbi:helix-turn-helix domain-containing protein [Shewanella sp. AS16]|uniref:ArsR/SmtB family transcription factor n=1 Tax=Shewanella sp. AS16 TaxID=2907625 RepID=UPI001F48865C|nr:helix-turn-helix domain-containing protein [Shewanella sp. AS16]MCE9684880.1 helix-turn-helix domain-containing protein [Shewanella sp. AS16]
MEPNIAFIAALIGDTARSRILVALLGGQALTATELAVEADVTAQTASSHLSKLVEGELLRVRKQGRHKYFQLQSPQVAELLESLLNISAGSLNPKSVHGPADPGLRRARVCYDHLAGELGVALYDALGAQQLLTREQDETRLTAEGRAFFAALGLDLEELKGRQDRRRRPLCKSCLDWSERRSHLAGALGNWILEDILAKGWAERALDSRAMLFTASGLQAFSKSYGLAEG